MEGNGDSNDGQGGGAGDPPPQRNPPKHTPENGGQETGKGRGKSKDEPSKFDRSLRLTDIFIAVFTVVAGLAAVASAAVAIWTANQLGATTAQTDKAIGKLATLADQTKRQADATTGQLDFLKQQVGEAKAQTKAISQQTTAIKSSSTAAIKLSTAQIQAANADASSHRPNVGIAILSIAGFKDKPDAAGHIPTPLNIKFANTGQGVMTPVFGRIQLLFAEKLPLIRPSDKFIPLGGYDGALPFGAQWGPVKPVPYFATVDEAKDVLSGKKLVFVFGDVTYLDGNHVSHQWCFAEYIGMKDGASEFSSTVGPPSYHCDT